MRRPGVYPPVDSARTQRVGWLLAFGGLLLYPLVGLLAGHPWSQAEVFGVTPEPTALLTLGLLLVRQQSGGCLGHLALVVPVLSLLTGAATLWALAG